METVTRSHVFLARGNATFSEQRAFRVERFPEKRRRPG